MAVITTIPDNGLSWGALAQGTGYTGGTGGRQAAVQSGGYQQRSYNKPASSLNGYGGAAQAMNYGAYGGGMGVGVTGLPVWGPNGQMQQQGRGGPAGAGGTPLADGGRMFTGSPQLDYAAQQAPTRQWSPQQLYLQSVMDETKAAKQANETRYDSILNRDTAAMENSFMTWLKGKYPGASLDAINKMVANKGIQQQYARENPNASASFGGYRDRYTRGMGYLQGAGQQARQDINNDYQKLGNNMQMTLNQRGLDSSTISQSMMGGNQRRKDDAVGRLNETLRKEYLDTDARLSKDTLDFMERRQDTYPDQAQVMDLMMKYGNSGVPNGGMMGGGYSNGAPTLQYAGTRIAPGFRSNGFGAPTSMGRTTGFGSV